MPSPRRDTEGAARTSPALHEVRATGDVARTTRDAYRTLSMSSVGLEMGLAVIIGLLFGRWLDGQIGTTPWMLILFTCFGMAAGMKGVFRAVRQADRYARENEAREAAAQAAAQPATKEQAS